MNKYKVEFIQTETFVVDVRAEDEKEAGKLAEKKFKILEKQGMTHYNQTGDVELKVNMVFDVTDTDDPFDECDCEACKNK